MPVSDKHASAVYANEMARLQEGHAMWIPEGPDDSKDVQLGDVGYINKNGAFIFLFSIYEHDARFIDDSDRHMSKYLPTEACHYFDFAMIKKTTKTYKKYMESGLHSSRTLQEKSWGGTLEGGPAPQVGNAKVKVQYSMKESQGATCWLPEAGVLKEVESNKIFEQYVKDNIYSWYEGVEKVTGIRLEDLIVVRGTIKSPQYKVVAIYSGQESNTVDVGAGAAGMLDIGVNMRLAIHRQAHYTERSSLTPDNVQHPVSPDQALLFESPGREQPSVSLDRRRSSTPSSKTPTIFLRYYKMKQRLGIWKTLKANAGPHVLPPPEDPSYDVPVSVLTDESDMENPPAITAIQPIDALLDYILEVCPDAERALACDEDVKSLFLGEELPEDILPFLRAKSPSIAVDERKVGSLVLEDTIRRERVYKIAGVGVDNLPEVDDPKKLSLLGINEPTQSSWSPLSHATITFRDLSGNDRTIKWPHQHLSEKAQQQGALKAMATSPDGKLIAAGFDDAAVIFWDLSTSTVIRPSSIHDDSVYALAFSPNGTEIASGSADTRITVRTVIPDKDGSGIDIDNGDLHILEGHKTDVTTVIYSPDGSRLVSVSLDGDLNVWDVSEKYALILTINNMTCPHWIAFTPDSKKIVATMDDTVIVWDATDGKILATMRGHEANIYMADISHDGVRVATVSEDQTARVWNIETGEELLTLHEHSAPVWCVAFSPDDSELVTGSDDANIVIADSWTGQQRAIVDEHKGSVNTLAYSKSGEWICVGTIESNVGLLDARSGRLVARYEGHEDKIRNVAFSPDADSIISSSDDGTVRIFSVMDVLRLR